MPHVSSIQPVDLDIIDFIIVSWLSAGCIQNYCNLLINAILFASLVCTSILIQCSDFQILQLPILIDKMVTFYFKIKVNRLLLRLATGCS